jgi:hypothetical protein
MLTEEEIENLRLDFINKRVSFFHIQNLHLTDQISNEVYDGFYNIYLLLNAKIKNVVYQN